MSTRRTSKTASAVRQNIEAVADATATAVEETLAIGAQAAESLVKAGMKAGMKAGTDVAFRAAEQVNLLTKQNMEKSSMTIFDRYEDLNGFGKDNVDALVKSTTALAKGLEDLGQALFKISQENMESTLAAAKSVLACTTLRQIVDFHNDLAKNGFDKLMTEASKVSELSLKVANDALEPIQVRVNVAVEKLIKPIAA